MSNIILPNNLKYINQILIHEELASTNDCALELERARAPSGTLVVALKQSAGRGRLCRPWFMGEGDIALSLLLRAPHVPLLELAKLAWVPAVAVVEALAELNISATLKWPNDIIIDPGIGDIHDYFGVYHKIGGVLVENIFKDQRVVASVLGLGINVRPNPKLKSLVPHAGCCAELKENISSAEIWPVLLKKLDQNLQRLLAPGGGSDIQARYESMCSSFGKRVKIESKKQIITGLAIGLNHQGFLIVDDGHEHHVIYAGDVNIQT